MDLIFQSGEFYNQDSTLGSILKLLLPLVGALISGGIAIWIFNRGIRKQREEEIAKEHRRLNEIKEYALTTLRLSISPIDQQIINYDALITDLRNPSDAISYSPTYEHGLAVVRNFTAIAFKDLHKAFLLFEQESLQEAIKLLQRVNVHMYYIDELSRPSFIKLFEYFDSERKPFITSYQMNIQAIIRYWNNSVSQLERSGGTVEQSTFLSDFDKLFTNWLHTERYNERYVAVEKYLKPLADLCQAHGHNQTALAILHCCDDCLIAYEGIKSLEMFVLRKIEERKSRLEKAKKDIQDFCDKYSYPVV